MTQLADSPAREITRFFVLDFDRCLGNTAKLYDLFETIVTSKTVLTAQQMRAARYEVEASAGSFDTVKYVWSELAGLGEEGEWAPLVRQYLAKSRQQDMLEAGACELLNFLDGMKAPYGIMTYGGREWQTIKLAAARLEDIPCGIVSSKAKGAHISQWRQADGRFNVPPELCGGSGRIVDRVTLIDDKAASFEGLPTGADGMCVLAADPVKRMSSQRGALPASVVAVTGLQGVITQLQQEYAQYSIDKT